MLVLSSDAIRALAPMPGLIECLRKAFCSECVVPVRQVMKMPGGAGERLFVSMPAFDVEGGAAVKVATVFPDNQTERLPTVQAAIVVFSHTGTPVAVLDGTLVTQLRTAAASGLASTYLSRQDSAHLVLVGTGALAPYMALAHCAVRPIQRVNVWGRRPEQAALTVAAIRALVPGIEVQPCESLKKGVAMADIVSCATRSPTPLVAGKWLRSGTFVDLVGSFSPTARESDDDVVLRSRIFVDTREGALAEAGDVLEPISRSVITKERIEGDLFDLARGRVNGRATDDEIILFKSVGTAIEDLAAAQMIVAASRQSQPPPISR